MSGSVPPSSRASAFSRAKNLFERFTGHSVEYQTKVTVPDLPKVAAVIGTLDGVLYTTVRDGKTERYIHKFKAADKALLCTTPDGRQLLIVGGSYRFTELGIVDGSDKKHAHVK